EEELEKSHNDLDELRQRKDEEIREKTLLIMSLQEQIRQKDIQFDALSGAKIQLDNEIALYRSIWSEAEKEAGYSCPLGSGSKKRKTDNGDTQSMDTPGSMRARQLARQDLEHVGTDDQNGASESEQGDGNEEEEEDKEKEKDEENDDEAKDAKDDEENDDENNKNRGN
ncbi:SWI/SNF2 like ATpase, partial [Reticulomyxa filosa]